MRYVLRAVAAGVKWGNGVDSRWRRLSGAKLDLCERYPRYAQTLDSVLTYQFIQVSPPLLCPCWSYHSEVFQGGDRSQA